MKLIKMFLMLSIFYSYCAEQNQPRSREEYIQQLEHLRNRIINDLEFKAKLKTAFNMNHEQLIKFAYTISQKIKHLKENTSDEPNEEFEVLLRNLYSKIEENAKKLNLFFKKSVENTINNCDDTKLLKELLDII